MEYFVKIEFECLCNLKCEYCHAGEHKYDVNESQIIEKMNEVFNLFSYNNTFFRVEGIGEITLYPKIIDYLTNKAKKEGYKIEVLSNGVLAYDFIKENESIKWVISLDGHKLEMNKYRKLSSEQVNRILNAIIDFNTEIQCVYSDQTIEEMNDFIEYLDSRNYKGFLHIFPMKHNDKPLGYYLDFNKLKKVNFIPDVKYYEKWKYIYENKMRNFHCDFFNSGFVYRIMHDEKEIRKIKCDCGKFKFEFNNLNENQYNISDCNTCINHFEYDVTTKLSNKI